MIRILVLLITAFTAITAQSAQSDINSCKLNNIKGLSNDSSPGINIRNFSYSFEKNQVLWNVRIFIHPKEAYIQTLGSPDSTDDIINKIDSNFINESLDYIFYAVGEIATYKPKNNYPGGVIRVLKRKVDNNNLDDLRFATWTAVTDHKIIITRFQLLSSEKTALKLSGHDVNETIQDFINDCTIWNSLEHDPLYDDSPI